MSFKKFLGAAVICLLSSHSAFAAWDGQAFLNGSGNYCGIPNYAGATVGSWGFPSGNVPGILEYTKGNYNYTGPYTTTSNWPATIGILTSGGDTYYSISLLTTETYVAYNATSSAPLESSASGPSTVPTSYTAQRKVWALFNTTAGTYSFTAYSDLDPTIQATHSGKFTGNITQGAYGNVSFSVTLDCGLTYNGGGALLGN